MSAPWKRPRHPDSDEPRQTAHEKLEERKRRRSEKALARYYANRDKVNEASRIYAAQNRAQARARAKLWAENNPEKVLAKNAARGADVEKNRVARRAYVNANREIERERQKAWRKANRDKINEYNRNRRAAARAAKRSCATEPTQRAPRCAAVSLV
jgi:hypothetical protein